MLRAGAPASSVAPLDTVAKLPGSSSDLRKLRAVPPPQARFDRSALSTVLNELAQLDELIGRVRAKSPGLGPTDADYTALVRALNVTVPVRVLELQGDWDRWLADAIAHD